MKATINTKTLVAALSANVKLIPARATLAVQENVFIMAADLGMAISASYNNTELVVKLKPEEDCTVEEGGTALVPARLLLDIVKTVEDEMVTLETAGGNAIKVCWSNGHSVIPTFDEKDYQHVTNFPSADAVKVTFPANELATALAATAYACSFEDDLHKVLRGVCIEAGPLGTAFAASDGRKLLVHELPDVATMTQAKFILDKVYVPLLAEVCKDAETVSMSVDGGRARFSSERKTLNVASVKGTFPRYRDVIPKNNGNVLTVDRKDFATTVKRIGLFSGGSQRNVLLNLYPEVCGSELEISSYGEEKQRSAKEKFNVDYAGKRMQIGFCAQHLQDILGRMEGEKVTLRFEDNRHAALIVPQEQAKSHSTTAVLVPAMTL